MCVCVRPPADQRVVKAGSLQHKKQIFQIGCIYNKTSPNTKWLEVLRIKGIALIILLELRLYKFKKHNGNIQQLDLTFPPFLSLYILKFQLMHPLFGQ